MVVDSKMLNFYFLFNLTLYYTYHHKIYLLNFINILLGSIWNIKCKNIYFLVVFIGMNFLMILL